MGLRFHRVLSMLPGARLNLSKSGASASLGPLGADVNISRQGVTTNAGIPGTGLSYRSRVGSSSTMIGVLALVAGLGFAAYKNADKIMHWFRPAVAEAQTAAPAASGGTIRFVHRNGSLLREEPKTSAHVLKKEMKGGKVLLMSASDGWAKVTDGNITGWMRASVLGEEPPR